MSSQAHCASDVRYCRLDTRSSSRYTLFSIYFIDDAAGFRNDLTCSRRRALSPSAVFERCLRALSSSAVAVEIGCAPGMTPCRMLNHVTVLLSPSSRELAPIPRLMLRYQAEYGLVSQSNFASRHGDPYFIDSI